MLPLAGWLDRLNVGYCKPKDIINLRKLPDENFFKRKSSLTNHLWIPKATRVCIRYLWESRWKYLTSMCHLYLAKFTFADSHKMYQDIHDLSAKNAHCIWYGIERSLSQKQNQLLDLTFTRTFLIHFGYDHLSTRVSLFSANVLYFQRPKQNAGLYRITTW